MYPLVITQLIQHFGFISVFGRLLAFNEESWSSHPKPSDYHFFKTGNN